MEYSDEQITRYVDAVDLVAVLIETGMLEEAVRALLDLEIIEYPEWLNEPSEEQG
jgi:hypothetical protein